MSLLRLQEDREIAWEEADEHISVNEPEWQAAIDAIERAQLAVMQLERCLDTDAIKGLRNEAGGLDDLLSEVEALRTKAVERRERGE